MEIWMKDLSNIYPFIINNRILYLSVVQLNLVEFISTCSLLILSWKIELEYGMSIFSNKKESRKGNFKSNTENESVRNFWPRALTQVPAAHDSTTARKTFFNSHLQRLAIPSPLSPSMIFPQEVWFSETLPRTVKWRKYPSTMRPRVPLNEQMHLEFFPHRACWS